MTLFQDRLRVNFRGLLGTIIDLDVIKVGMGLEPRSPLARVITLIVGRVHESQLIFMEKTFSQTLFQHVSQISKLAFLTCRKARLSLLEMLEQRFVRAYLES